MSADRVVRVTSDPLSASLPGETAILARHSGAFYGVTGVAARIWELVQEPRSVSEIVATLTGEYDVDAERCRVDVEALLGEMEQAGLVRFDGGRAP